MIVKVIINEINLPLLQKLDILLVMFYGWFSE